MTEAPASADAPAAAAALRPGRDRRPAERRQVDPAERAGRAEDQHHLETRRRPRATASPASAPRGEAQFVFVDTPGFQTRHGAALNRSLNRTVHRRRWPTSTWCCSSSRPAASARTTPRCWRCCRHGKPVLLVANKLDTVHRRADLAPWLQAMQAAPRRSPSSCRCRPTQAGRRRAPARHRRALPARAALALRRGRAHRPQRPLPRQPRSCARSCSA